MLASALNLQLGWGTKWKRVEPPEPEEIRGWTNDFGMVSAFEVRHCTLSKIPKPYASDRGNCRDYDEPINKLDPTGEPFVLLACHA